MEDGAARHPPCGEASQDACAVWSIVQLGECAGDWCHAIVPWVMTIGITEACGGRVVGGWLYVIGRCRWH